MKFSKNKHILENVDDTQAQLFFKRHLGTPECSHQVFLRKKQDPTELAYRLGTCLFIVLFWLHKPVKVQCGLSMKTV